MAETKAKQANTEAEQPVPDVVPRTQYESLLAQAQNAINDANTTIATLDADKKLLQDTLRVQNRLIERFLDEIK